MSTHDYVTIVRDMISAANDRDFDRVVAAVAEDYEVVLPNGQTMRGRESIRRMLRGRTTAFPDWKVEVVRLYVAEDSVAVESVFRGTHSGPLEGIPGLGPIPPTGVPVELRTFGVFEFKDGKLVRGRGYLDMAAFAWLQRLGLTPQQIAA
ncbi:MAG: DUF4440 domain-containing protein [Chloroflexota bacterium]|nr:MAG: DUF4440 domain-containing protein [Chloroflexota bacterium]